MTENVTTPPADQTPADAPVVQGDPAAPTNINPGTGQPYPPMGVPVDGDAEDAISDDPEDIKGDNVYMSISWMNVPKEVAKIIRDAVLTVSPDLVSYSVSFSSPLEEE